MISKEKSLLCTHPELAMEWNLIRNGELTPADVTAGSHKKVWWFGKCGHEWRSVIESRSNGAKCPFCSNKKVLRGFNDLATISSEVSAEWHPTLNGELTPFEVMPGSKKKVWWLGICGHEWSASIYSRHKGNGCPICAQRRQSSFPEQAIFYYVKKYFLMHKTNTKHFLTIGWN